MLLRLDDMANTSSELPALSQYARMLGREAKFRYIEKISAFGGQDPYLLVKDKGTPLLAVSPVDLSDTAYYDICNFTWLTGKAKCSLGKH